MAGVTGSVTLPCTPGLIVDGFGGLIRVIVHGRADLLVTHELLQQAGMTRSCTWE
jgi:hypothetical protein